MSIYHLDKYLRQLKTGFKVGMQEVKKIGFRNEIIRFKHEQIYRRDFLTLVIARINSRARISQFNLSNQFFIRLAVSCAENECDSLPC